jgi:predicted RNase H-like HicB family nuclease
MGIVSVVVRLRAEVKRERGGFVSCAPDLDVWSQGSTEKRALDHLAEAVRVFLVACFERGTLDDVLKECGWTAIKRPEASRKGHKKGLAISVEIPFRAAALCHA